MECNAVIRNKTVFITGGAGFIGTQLAARLVETNRVIVYARYKGTAFRRWCLQYPFCGLSTSYG